MHGKLSASPTPRQRIQLECQRRGNEAVAVGCCRLIAGENVDADLIHVLGGAGATYVIDNGPDYWLRVWGTRGLLWNWRRRALPSVRLALRDDAWRVREMACKVVARHQIGDLLQSVADLRDDPIPRVRTAATRAVTVLTASRA